MLTRSKGPSVWTPRAQSDRALYRRAVRALIERLPTLELTQGMETRLIIEGTHAAGVATSDGRVFAARAAAITAATILPWPRYPRAETQKPAAAAGGPDPPEH